MAKKEKSLKLNMLLNSFKGLMNVIFPLITFPYVSRVLGVDTLGKYNFSYSIIGYFVLLAGLGINTYAIRQGARYREDAAAIRTFANEMYTINLISTVASYAVFALCLLILPKLRDYRILLAVLSLQIIFKVIGVEWLYSIYEDYAYITIRSIAFQLLSLISMFLFVHRPSDLYIYAFITVMAHVGSNVFNYFHARKAYFRVCPIRHVDWKAHMRPILVLFATAVTVTIYVNSDITVLGFLSSDHRVGIYTVSVKVYTVLKSILSSALIVSIPRMSACAGKGDLDAFRRLGRSIYHVFLSLVMPAMFGIVALNREIVSLISGPEYIEACSSLILLSIALFFCLGAGYWSQCVMIPLGMENQVFRITVISAIVNIVLNLALIPLAQENAAAVTTIIAEAIVFFYCRHAGKQSVPGEGNALLLLKVIVGCAAIIGVSLVMHRLLKNRIAIVGGTIVLSALCYGAIEILLKNSAVTGFIKRERLARLLRR